MSSTHIFVTYLPIGCHESSRKGRISMIEYRNKAYKCPMEMTIDLIGGKWKALLLWHLSQGVLRFNELARIFPDMSQKMLTQQLRDLEEDGLLQRTVYPQIPPKVEYALTEFGSTLIPVLQEMNKWGTAYAEAAGRKATEGLR